MVFMTATVKRRSDRIVIYCDGDLFIPALALSGAGGACLYRFRGLFSNMAELSDRGIFLTLASLVCLLSGLLLFLKASYTLCIDGGRGALELGFFFLPKRRIPFEELSSVVVEACHRYCYDKSSGRPVVRSRRFWLGLARDDCSPYWLLELRDYGRAMALAQEMVTLSGLSLRKPKRAFHIFVDECR